jgi:hypothetical protein
MSTPAESAPTAYLNQIPMEVIRITIPHFYQDVVVFYGGGKKDIKKYLLSIGGEFHKTMVADSLARTSMDTQGRIIIHIAETTDKYELINVVAHESLHAATFLYDRIGVKFKLGTSDEAFAYLTGYFTELICRELIK